MGYTESFPQNREPIERPHGSSSSEHSSVQNKVLPKLKRSEKAEAFANHSFNKEQLARYQNELREDYLSYRIIVDELGEDENNVLSEDQVSELYQGLALLDLNAEFLEERIDALQAKITQIENTSPPWGMVEIILSVAGVAITLAIVSQLVFRYVSG